jgi:hypothetical protein
MKKHMMVSVDIKIARQMLRLAGYWDVDHKTDDEVFDLALSMNDCYGVTYEESEA